MVKTLVMLGIVSVGSAVIEHVLYTMGKSTEARYVSLAGTAGIALTSLKGVKDLLDFIGKLA